MRGIYNEVINIGVIFSVTSNLIDHTSHLNNPITITATASFDFAQLWPVDGE